jgi:ABC-type uncharacterized transport system involved in gliding motility auxiliary subunit
MGWRRTGYGVGGLAALAVLFLGVVMLSNLGLRGMRLDLTENHLYTLSGGTRQVLTELKEPVDLYFYFSRDAAERQSPLLMPYANRVREFLEEITARSGGKIRLHVIDPQPFSDDEDHAAEAGLQALPTNDAGGESLYFGLAGTNSTDGRSVIPNFQPDREEFLEYDVAKLVQELANPKKPVVGLVSSLPLQGQFNPMTGQMGDTWPVLSQIEQLFTVRSLTSDLDHIDRDVDVLMIVHPKNLAAEDALRHRSIRDARRQGAALRRSEQRRRLERPGSAKPFAGATANHSSDLEPLLTAWGVAYDPTKVIGDLDLGLEVRATMQGPPTRHIAILGIAPRRHGQEGRRHGRARHDQRRHRRVPRASPRRDHQIRALAHELDQRRADSLRRASMP